MRTRQSLALVGIFTIMLFLSGFGTEVWGHTYYWAGPLRASAGPPVVTIDWNDAANWRSATGATFPGSGDVAIFSASYSIGGTPYTQQYWNVYIPVGGIAVGTVTIEDLGTTGTAAVQNTVTLYGDGTLTISTALTLESDAQLDLRSLATVALQLNGSIELQSGSGSGLTTQLFSTSSGVIINLGANSDLTMGNDLRTTFFGEGIETHLYNPGTTTPTFGSHVLFLDDVVIENNISLGNTWNLWLGPKANLIPAPNNQQQRFFFTSSTLKRPSTNGIGTYVGGLIVKAKSYWVDDNNNQAWNTSNWPTTTDGYFDFPVGSLSGGQNPRESYISIWIKRALNLPTTGSGIGYWQPSADEPFRAVGVRIVDAVHEDNVATRPVQRYWVLQPFGMYQDNGPVWSTSAATTSAQTNVTPYNYICILAQVFTSDVTAPARAYAARYTQNWEETTGNWYTDGSITGGTNIRSRTWVEMCGSTDAAWGFGDVSIADNTDPLPVELTTFSARVIDNTVKLNWETATEVNNFGFYVERSSDGENWKEIGFVLGYGTSYSPKNYVYIDELKDEMARLPKLAYRLRQMDRDGTTEYSNIVFVNMGELPEGIQLYAAYPNPFNPATTISFAIGTPSNVTLKVYNTLGQTVATLLAGSAMDAGLHTVPFDGATLPSGVYMAVLEADGAVQHQKLVLNK